MADRYNVSNLKQAIKNPNLFIEEIVKLSHQLNPYPVLRKEINKIALYRNYGDPIDVINKDWDNLIILDACRYDSFKQINHIEGELKPVLSKGSHSDEFIIENFNGKKLHDTIYISSNPHADKTLDNNVFYKTEKTYSNKSLFDRQITEYSPEAVTELAIENYKQYPNKRVIAHYMQPHVPYMGKSADKKKKELLEFRDVLITNGADSNDRYPKKDVHEYRDFLRAARDNHISDDELNDLYIDNLKLVLKNIEELVDVFEGKTIITADHGELLGNPTTLLPIKEKYSHPRETYVPELRVVPWLIIDSDTRREIKVENPLGEDSVAKEQVQKQLKALGYSDRE